ncbi:DUF1217 domain-containing protein [Azospirillum sp. SYSU D00513]|uniref:DUF1217 domain-containing protein n=1 Tax=Azospirillum sp. SYSU D00513 TaxID=2812561 RepID=UPI001A97295E|nr:DUF1217 domain-containing protein [Azospirillum sp. SYSU D00513]
MQVTSPVAAAAAFVGSTGLPGWKLLSGDLDRRMGMFAKDPYVSRETQYFRENIGKVRTVDDLMKDRRLYDYAINAYGLDSMSNSQAMMRKVLSEDLSNPAATANRLSDPRFKQIAQDFGMAVGSNRSGDVKRVESFIDAYVTALYQKRTGENVGKVPLPSQTEAMDAIREEPAIEAEIEYFRSKITDVGTPADVRADKRLMTFALTGAGWDKPQPAAETVERALSDEAFRDGLADERWETLGTFFSFLDEGRKLLADPIRAMVKDVVGRYVRNSFELETGRTLPKVVSEQLQKELDAFAAKPVVKEQIAQFEKAAQELESPADLVANPKAYKFVLRAYDLDSFSRNTTMIIETLVEPSDSVTSPAHFDQRFRDMAEGMAFLSRDSMPPFKDSTFIDKVVEGYHRWSFEASVGEMDSNLRTALFAQRTLPKITSPFGILADTNLTSFVFGAIGLPTAASGQDIDKLADMIKGKLDFDRLDDPAYFDELANRFLASSSGIASASSFSPALTMFGSAGTMSTVGLDIGLLLSIQGN